MLESLTKQQMETRLSERGDRFLAILKERNLLRRLGENPALVFPTLDIGDLIVAALRAGNEIPPDDLLPIVQAAQQSALELMTDAIFAFTDTVFDDS